MRASSVINVLSETGAHEICSIELDANEMSIFGDDLLSRICSSRETQKLFTRDAQASTFKLCDANGKAIAPHVMHHAGDTVYLHSNKDATASNKDATAVDTECTVAYNGIELVVPRSPKDKVAVLSWACDAFLIDARRHELTDSLEVVPADAKAITCVRYDNTVLYAPFSRNLIGSIRLWACVQLKLNVLDHALRETGNGDYTLVEVARSE
jgi:hypothetical protein